MRHGEDASGLSANLDRITLVDMLSDIIDEVKLLHLMQEKQGERVCQEHLKQIVS